MVGAEEGNARSQREAMGGLEKTGRKHVGGDLNFAAHGPHSCHGARIEFPRTCRSVLAIGVPRMLQAVNNDGLRCSQAQLARSDMKRIQRRRGLGPGWKGKQGRFWHFAAL